MRANARLVNHHEGSIQHVDLSVLNEDHRYAIFHRQWLEGWEHQQGAMLSRPQPKALAGPIPATNACAKAAVLRTSRKPSKQTRWTQIGDFSALLLFRRSWPRTTKDWTEKPWRSPCLSIQAVCSFCWSKARRLPLRQTVGL